MLRLISQIIGEEDNCHGLAGQINLTYNLLLGDVEILNCCLNIVVRFNKGLAISKDRVITHPHEVPHFINIFAKERTTSTVPYTCTDTRHVYYRTHNSCVILKCEVDL